MFDRDRWNEIFDTIRNNKLRTALSGFTVFIGIFIFTTLTGMGNGLRNSFIRNFKNSAPNAIYLYPGFTSLPHAGFKSNRRIRFTNADLRYIKRQFSDKIECISGRVSKNLQLRYGDQYGDYPVLGVGPAAQFIEQTQNFAGRYINRGDMQQKRKVAVIGRQLAIDLFGHQRALGRYIQVGDTPFKIVGIFTQEGGNTQQERLLYVPLSTLQSRYSMGDFIDQITLNYNLNMGIRQALAFGSTLKETLKQRHAVSPKDQAAIYVHNVVERQKNANTFLGVIMVIVVFISAGTLIAGAIGISNIMVFVVKQRTKEIGIRKALGATPRAIIGLILQESLFITSISGYLGLLAGLLTLHAIGDGLKAYFITNPHVSSSIVVTATLLLILSGALAGYVPARRAARIKPIVALNDA